MKYPIGPVYRMLLLTGLRLNEARAAVVAGGSGRRHHHPGGADEGQGWQGARTSGAVVVGGAGGHRIAAAHQGRDVPVLLQRGQATAGDDRPDQARSGPAHAADARRRWPAVAARIITPSRCRIGPTTICAAPFAPDCRRFASRTTSPKPCLRTGRPASSAPMTLHEYLDEKREALEAMGAADRVHRQPGCRARQGRQAARGGDDHREFFTYTDAQWDPIKGRCWMISASMPTRSSSRSRRVSSTATAFQAKHHRDGAAAEPHRDGGDHVSCTMRGRSPRRDELNTLREDAENLRASIIDAVAVQ